MKHFALLLLLASTVCFADDIPDAPTPNPILRSVVTKPIEVHARTRVTDYSLWFAVAAAEALDWTSTEQCLRRPYAQCHEAELPNALVENKVGFALFKGAEAAGAIYGQRLLEHHHRKLAYALQSINVGLTLGTDLHNYQLAKAKGK